MRALPADRCLALVHTFEGDHGAFEPSRTLDPAGNYEIGWSHKLSGPEDPLWYAQLSLDEANALALEDLGKAAAGVCNALDAKVYTLTDGQYAAVIDFAYNEGVGAFTGSTLCHWIIEGNLQLASAQFGKWVYSHVNGLLVEEPGLVRRRAAELDCWNAKP